MIQQEIQVAYNKHSWQQDLLTIILSAALTTYSEQSEFFPAFF
jgi:hypothetical protein